MMDQNRKTLFLYLVKIFFGRKKMYIFSKVHLRWNGTIDWWKKLSQHNPQLLVLHSFSCGTRRVKDTVARDFRGPQMISTDRAYRSLCSIAAADIFLWHFQIEFWWKLPRVVHHLAGPKLLVIFLKRKIYTNQNLVPSAVSIPGSKKSPAVTFL